MACLDDRGKTVDWFILYKLPRYYNNPSILINDGVGYVYMTSRDYSDGWIFSTYGVDDAEGMVGRTLTTWYDYANNESNSDLIFINYNDEFPDGTTSYTSGHSKGVTAFNSVDGFWLYHNVPRFPPSIDDGFAYPSTGEMYGQSMFCVSLGVDQANTVGALLTYDNPNIFESAVGDSVDFTNTATLASVAEGTDVETEPWYLNTDLTTTTEGITINAFAKGGEYDADIYTDLIAPGLNSDLYVESWRASVASNCTVYEVLNVEEVDVYVADYYFSSYYDHSKYAVSQTSDNGAWVCIGDLNRAETQYVRGGGALCIDNRDVWEAYIGIIEEVAACGTNLNN